MPLLDRLGREADRELFNGRRSGFSVTGRSSGCIGMAQVGSTAAGSERRVMGHVRTRWRGIGACFEAWPVIGGLGLS